MTDELVLRDNPAWLIGAGVGGIGFAALFVLLGFPLWLSIPVALASLTLAYGALLLVPYCVTVNNEGTIEFRSVLRRRATNAWKIRSIKTVTWTHWREKEEPPMKVRFDGGRVILLRSRAQRFVRTIRSLNPAVVVQP